MESIRLLGTAEVASLLNVSKQTVANWRVRHVDFPAPVAELASGPVWQEGDVVAWAIRNGIAAAGLNIKSVSKPTTNAVVVAFVNMKGGVGKSTLTANMGWFCSSKRNKRVLLIDLDPQFNLTQYVLGVEQLERILANESASVIDIFEHLTPSIVSRTPKKTEPKDAILKVKTWSHGGKLDIVPSRLELAFTLKNPTGKEQLLSKFVKSISANYDLVLIDCSPTESMLTDAAYLASDYIVVPVRPDFLSTIGLPLLARSLADFRERYEDHEIKLAGILFNAIYENKSEHRRSRREVQATATEYGWYVFQNEVSYSDSYPRGSRLGKPIFATDYARWEKIAEFSAVAGEIMKRVGL
jgi:chromosome partitioning protein